MIRHDLDEAAGRLIVQPEAPLTREDFQQLAQAVDPYLERAGGLRGLLIDAPRFPGWRDFAGLVSHFRFIHDHHQRIRRVALVTDEPLARFVPPLARHFVRAELRHFPGDQREAALAWLAGEELPAPSERARIRFTELTDPRVLWLELGGHVTREDYLELLRQIEPRLSADHPVACLVELKELDRFAPGTLWEDLKFGLRHERAFTRVALVAERKWLVRLASVADRLTPVPVRVFSPDQEQEAWEWVTDRAAGRSKPGS